MPTDGDEEDARRERARKRAARSMTIERVEVLGEEPPLYEEASLEARLEAMARLCRAAWLFSGRPWPEDRARAEMPGEIYELRHERAARSS